MKKKLWWLLTLLLFCNVGFSQNLNAIEQELQEVLNKKSDDMIDISIILKSQINTKELESKAAKADNKSHKREIVVSELKKFAAKGQADVMAILQAEEASGNVKDINALWIVNAISCKTTRDVIYQLSTHPDIKVISYNNEVQIISEQEMKEMAEATRGGYPYPHVTAVKAHEVWSQGYTGKNVIVAVLDSGTNIYHTDIKNHLWEGEENGEIVNGWNFVANNSNIIDDNGHGTHCAGIICADGTSGQTAGVAPDALLMTVKTINRAGGGSVDNMISGVQFAINNGADILSISNGFKNSQLSIAQKEIIRETFDNVLRVGVITCAAAGNDGNNYGAPDNVDYPAACPSPWRNPDQTLEGGLSSVVCVGAYDLSESSSRGPSTWQDTKYNDYQYSKWLHYCTYSNNDYGYKHYANTPFYWAVRYTPNMLRTYSAIKTVSVYGTDANPTISIYVYQGGDNAPQTLLYSEENVTLAKSQWNDVTLSKQVDIDPSKSLWLVFKGYEAAYSMNSNNNIDSRYFSEDGKEWNGFELENNPSNGLRMWLVRGLVEDKDGNTSMIGLIRPDISAPGDQVYSLNHTKNDKYQIMSGTSQATPCVAGVIALMLEKNHSLTPAQITEIIETTAAEKPETKNNSVGAGRVDAKAAVEATTEGETTSYIKLHSFSPDVITQGDNKQINLSFKNYGKGASSANVTYTISLNDDPYVTLVGSNTITLGNIAAQGVKESSFKINVNSQTPNDHSINVTLTTTDGTLSLKDNFTVKVVALPNIVFKSCNTSNIKPEDGNVNISVTMQNNGTAPTLNDTEITLSATTGSLDHVTIIDDNATIGPLGVNETATANFTIAAKENAKDGYLLDLFLETFSVNNNPLSFVYEFESDMEGWTSFDAANNDISSPWWHSSETLDHGKDIINSHSGSGHISSETLITKGMHMNYDHPIDNYVVSPNKVKITADSKVSFYARAHRNEFYPEHFGVAVSETSKVAGFETIQEWTITEEQATSWVKYTVDLSQYEGKEIYVAIRHFFTEDEWGAVDNGWAVEALNIDDIELSNIIINYHHIPSYDDTDENYFNIAIINPIDLGAPTGLEVTNCTAESISLKWDALKDAQSYNVYRDGAKIANVTTNEYTDNNLTHMTEYCYTVTGINSGCEHEHSDEVCATTLQKDYSTAIKEFTPEVVYADGSAVNLDITFINDGKKEHETRIEITLSSDDEYVEITTATAYNAVMSPNQEILKTFTFAVNPEAPHNHVINFIATVKYVYSPYTSWELPLSIVVKNDPNAPKNLTANTSENSVTLNWSPVDNAIRYNVYRNGDFIGNTAATTYYDGGLESNTEYRYQVSGITASGESELCKEITATTLAASSGIVLQSFTMGAAIGQNVELTATMINKGSEATPEATTATLSCDNQYVTIVDATDDLGSMAAGATATATFIIKLDANIPSNYNLNFDVTAEYQNSNGDGIINKSYTFDNDLEGWTTDITVGNHNWYHSTLQSEHGYNKNYNTGGFIFSESYCNSTNDGFDPNHWIVMPEQIVPSNLSTFEFYACSMSNSNSYADETFGVFVSTTSNTDPNAFTEVERWTLAKNSNSRKMALKSAPIYDYEGQKIWVAIRHFGAGDNAALAVDNITIYNLVQSSTISTTSSFSVTANQSLNIFAGTGSWNVASKWSKGSVPTETDDVIINGNATIEDGNIVINTITIEKGTLTINNDAALVVNSVFINTDSDAFIINDGAQVKLNNDNVAATFKMDIVNQSPIEGKEGVPGWQFISSPFTNASVSAFTTADEYDLYKYNGGKAGDEWDNHKTETGIDANFETEFVNGRGYLASYETATTATLSGTLNAEKTFDRTYSYTAGDENILKNFFLVGNPFPFNMDLSKFNLNNVYNGFATVDPETGAYIKHTKEEDNIIPVGDGFFIETIGEFPSVSYNAGSKSRGEKYEYINVVASGKQGSNNVIIKLSGAEERGFSKLENLNQSIADLYVKNNGRQYSILGYDRDVQEIELFFDAKEMGNYSIRIESECKFGAIILIDRFTGIETNMILGDEYWFTAKNNDDNNRFVIKFVERIEKSDIFAHQIGEELIIDAEGTIQIIDMMGRVVYNNDVESCNNRINVSNLKGSAYIVRNISSNEVKTQKIVIR